MLALPEDVRRQCLRGLCSRDLASVEGTCVALRGAIDECWQDVCYPFFCATPSLLAPSYKQCFLSANGWAHIAHVPRRTISASAVASAPTSRTARTRNTNVLHTLNAWDSSDTILVFANDLSSASLNAPLAAPHVHVHRFDEADACVSQQALALHDPNHQLAAVSELALLPDGQPERALVCTRMPPGPQLGGMAHAGQGPRVHAIRPKERDTEALEAVPLWTLPASRAGMDVLQLAWAGTDSDRVLVRREWGIELCDTRTGSVLARRLTPQNEAAVDVCFPDAVGSPHVVAFAAQGGSYAPGVIAVCDLRSSSQVNTVPGAKPDLALCTPHRLIRRLRAGPSPYELLSTHMICKDIEAWDVRKLGREHWSSTFQGGLPPMDVEDEVVGIPGRTLSELAPKAAPTRAVAHCAGNGPDFEYAHSTLVCVSRGAPGTTFGAKLQVFAEQPRRIKNSFAVLPVGAFNDKFDRFRCSRGLRLGRRTLTVLADSERFIRCAMPTSSMLAAGGGAQAQL